MRPLSLLLPLCLLLLLAPAAIADDLPMKSVLPPPDWDTVIVLGTNGDKKAELSWQWWVANYAYEGGQAYLATTPKGVATSLADAAHRGGILAWPCDASGNPWRTIAGPPPMDQLPQMEKIYVEAPGLYAAAHDPGDGEPPRWWLWRTNTRAWNAQATGADPLVRDHRDWAVHYTLQGLSIAIKEASWKSEMLPTSLGDLLRDRHVVLIEDSRTALRDAGYEMICWYLPLAKRVVVDIRHKDHPAFYTVIPLDRTQELLSATRSSSKALALTGQLGAPTNVAGMLGVSGAVLWGDLLSMDGLPVARWSEIGG